MNSCVLTFKAFRSVDTDQFSTFRTFPATVLIFNKVPDAQSFDILKVFKHTHAIFFPIPLIKILQSFTWKSRAGMITIFPFAFIAKPQGAGLTTFGVGCKTTVTFILFPQVSYA